MTNQGPAFTERREGSDWVAEVPWPADLAAKCLTGLALLGVFLCGGIAYLDGAPVSLRSLAADALVLAALVYFGMACFRNRTLVRVKREGGVIIRHGPLPLVPGSRLRHEELETVQSYWYRSPLGMTVSWRVAVIARGGRHHPVCVGGLDYQEEAERLAQALRNRLRLPVARADAP